MTIFNGAIGRSLITPKPISLYPTTIVKSSIAPIPWPADGGWTISAGVGGTTAVAKAGTIVFAVVGSVGATVNSLTDTSGTSWEIIGQNASYEGLCLLRGIVPAGGWNSLTSFNLKCNWGSDEVAMLIVNFAQCHSLPRTNDFFPTSLTGTDTNYDTTIGATLLSNCIQYAVVGAYFSAVNGPNPGTTGGWILDNTITGLSTGKVNFTTFWRKSSDNNTTLLKSSGSYANYMVGWTEAGF